MRPARGDWMEQERRELEESFRAISEQKTAARDQAGRAVQVAIQHFDAPGVSRDLLAPLLEIQIVFDEGERGLLHPLFEPDEKLGRPRRRWRWAGKGPAFRKFGRAVRYALSDLEALNRGGIAHIHLGLRGG